MIEFGEVNFRPPRPRSAPKRPRDGLHTTLELLKTGSPSPFEEVEVSMGISITKGTVVYKLYTM